jgi:hypothetical protein
LNGKQKSIDIPYIVQNSSNMFFIFELEQKQIGPKHCKREGNGKKTRLLSKLHSLTDYFVFFVKPLCLQGEAKQNCPAQGEQTPVERRGPPNLMQQFEK